MRRQKIAVQEWAANHPIGQLYEEVAVLIPCYNEETTVGKATGTGILAALSFCIGVILETIAQCQNENFQLLRRLLQR